MNLSKITSFIVLIRTLTIRIRSGSRFAGIRQSNLRTKSASLPEFYLFARCLLSPSPDVSSVRPRIKSSIENCYRSSSIGSSFMIWPMSAFLGIGFIIASMSSLIIWCSLSRFMYSFRSFYRFTI